MTSRRTQRRDGAAPTIATAMVATFALTGAVFANPHAAGATTLAALGPATAPAAPTRVLSPEDAQRYQAAFAAMRRADFIAGDNLSLHLGDPLLKGELSAVKLLHPAYRASFGEAKAWLELYRELPQAERVYDLAMKKKPFGAPAPAAPVRAAQADAWGEVDRVAETIDAKQNAAPRAANGGQQAAREAFYKGDVQRALTLAWSSGERWIGGLSAYRLKRYADAEKKFAELAGDPRQSPWVRSSGAYWAAKAARLAGHDAAAPAYLKTAARAPDTFYGLIATRELAQINPADPIGDIASSATLDPAELAAMVRGDPRARRAAALAQIGMMGEAGEELRASSPGDRPKYTALAVSLNVPVTAGADVGRSGWNRFSSGSYPTPNLDPKGGFTIDKALVYALIRQESKFNPMARSGAGAYGLMQLTAETASRLAGDTSLRRNPRRLHEPGLNLRLGQDYVAKLLGAVGGDMLKAVAAYNCGPGVIYKLMAKMGGDNNDSLLVLESMPAGQTRTFVQRVMSNYWIYRQIFGLDSHTLTATASGNRAVAALDRPAK